MKRRRVFQVVVEYDTEHDREGHPYPWWPNPERTNPPMKPDEKIDAESILYRIVDVPCDGWEWFADVKVIEERPDRCAHESMHRDPFGDVGTDWQCEDCGAGMIVHRELTVEEARTELDEP